MSDSFGAKGTLQVGERSYEIYRLSALEDRFGVSRLPYSMKVLLENLLRHEDGLKVFPADVEAVAAWDGGASTGDREIQYLPGRVLMQDFTGVPAVVDLAAMRDAVAERGGDAASLDPLTPADLVIDHSVSVDHFATADSLSLNTTLEFERNRERYQFLRWGQQAFGALRVVPPETGICHQVNLEHLSTVVAERDGVAFPDTCVGTDSHTPMVNGLGVVAWGVGGIEAEAAMLRQPISMLIPKVIGIELSGSLPAGATATDLVLTVTEMLRRHGVVGTFVEFYGPGVANVPLENRATIGNMSPEYGSTITIFPVDDETLRYLRFSGRPEEVVARVEAYAKEQGLWHDPDRVPTYTETLQLDLGTIEPSLAGPARPQDRVPLARSKAMFCEALATQLPAIENGSHDQAVEDSFPASDPPSATEGITGEGDPDRPRPAGTRSERPHVAIPVTLADGTHVDLDHGHVAIAAITSCTNTSNPSVMLAAGLLARNAVERGLTRKPWVKTSLAPGSKVSIDYFERSGLQPYLDKLGFNVVGFGCTTCIGNSGPLDPAVSAAVENEGLALTSVLSGNRNFEGRINPDVRMNYLASPPLVVAYALAGTMDIDLGREPLGHDPEGRPVMLEDLWPGAEEIQQTIRDFLAPEGFADAYATAFQGGERWQRLPTPEGPQFTWDESSTYIQRAPYFDAMPYQPAALRPIEGARVLAVLGDSVTTDHISPAGAIHPDSPAGRWLLEQGVERGDFNSYGSRRGNHHVMIRGTFANRRIRNRLAQGTEGGVTRHLPSGDELSIYDAAERYRGEDVPLVVLAGKEYGSGSSRDWAAKGTMLLGIRAVVAESYERIHRSNLVGMGVLPLQFCGGDTVESLGLTGEETFTVDGVAVDDPATLIGATVTVHAGEKTFEALVRIDTPMEAIYYHHGGILPYVVRQHLAS